MCLERGRSLWPVLAMSLAAIAPAVAADAPASARAAEYSVINPGPADSPGVLNERGEVTGNLTMSEAQRFVGP